MNITKAERKRLRALLAKVGHLTYFAESPLLQDEVAVLNAAVNALPALLAALDEAERLLGQACGADTEWDIDAARAFLREREG